MFMNRQTVTCNNHFLSSPHMDTHMDTLKTTVKDKAQIHEYLLYVNKITFENTNEKYLQYQSNIPVKLIGF